MWNRKLKNRLNYVEYRLRCIENPHVLILDQKIYGITERLSLSERVILNRVKGAGNVVKVYRDDEGYPMYDVYIKKEGLFKRIKPYYILTKKPKKK